MINGPFQAEILSNEKVSPSTFLLTLSRPPEFADAGPGQFVSIRTGSGLLRRPYSIMDLTEWGLVLLVKIVGPGSSEIASKGAGETIDLIGPLGGTVFELDECENGIFVAGGTGLAPLVFASRRWKAAGIIEESHLLYGASCAAELLTEACREDFDRIHIATIDGSEGFKGDVVELLADLRDRGEIPGGNLFSCGPSGMVRALVAAGSAGYSKHSTSLETIMACGIVACRGCVVPVRSGGEVSYRSVCEEGTVFAAEDIDWENWKE
jgi:dihydroorotate dehydrogenase electron transfer subunit